ncbi:transcriptional regulator [Galbibacter mesophilus]|uniref:transcriptional regulator n=1 Tax=Galbibacter mesophilus TaxID=379069 RepID=UPI00191EFA52|nr:transcriptional regulator [Galbibacter mesophilus]MCM5663967.1 transcriptional regulator [Galbibacter mesophilus]
MRILKYLIFLFLILAIGLSIYVAIQPDEYKIVKTRVVYAPKAVIYEYINNIKSWEKWSVWYDQDPNMKVTYGENFKGDGASASWDSEVHGKGTITSDFNSIDSLSYIADITEPKDAKAHRFFTLDSTVDENEVIITSGIEGNLSFKDKFFILFQHSMENKFGSDFENSLAKLDSVVIADMKTYSITPVGKTEYGGGYYLYETTSAKQNEIDLAAKRMFPEIEAFMEQNLIQSSGNRFTLFEQWDESNNSAIFSTAIPVKERIITPAGSSILCGFIDPGIYYKTVLKGDTVNINEAWSKAREAIKKDGLEIDNSRKPFETYIVTKEDSANPADFVSEIYIPIVTNTEDLLVN